MLLATSSDSAFSPSEPTFFEGLLELLEEESWKIYWFVLKTDKIYFFDTIRTPKTKPRCISLDSIQQVRKLFDGEGRLLMVLCTKELDLLSLRATNKEEGNKWLFGFQKCIIYQSNLSKQNNFPIRRRAATDTSFDSSPVKSPPIVKSLSANSIHQLLHSKAPSMKVAIGTEQGRRHNNEDRFILFQNFNDTFNLNHHPPQALFGVFDGHSGDQAVEFVASHLPPLLASHSLFQDHPQAAFVDVFERLDKDFLSVAQSEGWRAGTTALIVLIREDTLWVSHVGDCRAVLCRDNKAVPLTQDHVPSRIDEKQRIEAAGGWIESAEVLNIPKLYRLHLEDEELEEEMEELIGWVKVERVNGCLGMTRSIGDILIKDLREQQFGQEFSGNLVIPTPEVTSLPLDPLRDKFLIVASDGLWNVFGNQEAVEFVRISLVRQKPLQNIVEELVNMALELGSLDNITVLLIQFSD